MPHSPSPAWGPLREPRRPLPQAGEGRGAALALTRLPQAGEGRGAALALTRLPQAGEGR